MTVLSMSMTFLTGFTQAPDPSPEVVVAHRSPGRVGGPRRSPEGVDHALSESRPGSAKARIMVAADRLFYGEGIHTVGVQRVIEESEVTRVTFYRHFPSKDDLVLAYLARRAERARAAVTTLIAAHPGDPRGALHAWAVAFVNDGVIDEYRGCTFVNAAAEYAEPDHPVRVRAIEQRRWINQVTEDLVRQVGHPDPRAATRELLALRTGYVYSVGLEEPQGWEADFLAAHDRIVDGR